MKKVLILTVGLGGGHKAMARNMKDIFQISDKTVEVKIIDVLHEAWPMFSDKTSAAYAGSTSHLNAWLFRAYYVATDRFPQPLQWVANLMFRKYARRTYAKERPDLMITAFPFIADIAAKARDHHHGTSKIIQTITDASRVQGIWLTKYADMTLTATEDSVEYLVSRGMNPDKVTFQGFAASKTFYESTQKEYVRKRLGLNPDVFTILLTAGGEGLNPHKVLQVAQWIGKLRIPYQIILNAGHNYDLLQEFKLTKFPYASKVIVEGFTSKMSEYMRASDVICTKSGWLTVHEALVLQRPLILYDAIPGHEEQNAAYVEGNNFGIYAPEPKLVKSHLEHLIADAHAFDACITSMKEAKTNENPYPQLSAFMMSYLNKQQ